MQPPWLFRRKASPTRSANGKTANLTIGSLFAFFASKSIRIETDLLLPFCLAAEICVMAIGGNNDSVFSVLNVVVFVIADHSNALVLFMVCAVFRTGPSAVIAVGFTALMLGAVLAVLKCGIFAQTLIAVVITTIYILATAIFSQSVALETPAVGTVGFKITNRHFSAPITHILLGL